MKLRSQYLLLLMVLLLGNGIYAQNSSWTTYNTQNSDIGGNTILALATDSRGNHWVGTNLGLCKLSGRSWTDYAMFNEKLKDQFVNCLTVDNRGKLWIGTDDYGVIEFDGAHWTEHTQQTRQLGMKFIRYIVTDRNDTKWIGVTLGGLVSYNSNSDNWTKYTAQNSGLSSDFLLCMAIDNNNVKWIGTNDGLCTFNGSSWNTYSSKNSRLPNDIVPAIAIDKQGVKWIGTLGGLARFDGTQWTIFNKSNSKLPSNQINDLVFDAAGALWIATDQGVAVFDGKKDWHVYPPSPNTLPAKMIQKLVIDEDGNKWFGTDFYGLARLSAHGVKGKVTYANGNPVPGVTVQCGSQTVTTGSDGTYYLEVPIGRGSNLKATLDGFNSEPAERSLNSINGFLFGQDFVMQSGKTASGNSTERITVNPNLDQGYITISMESSTAEVEFVDANSGKSVRTIAQYHNGDRITISKMPKGNYTLYIRTSRGEKNMQFILK